MTVFAEAPAAIGAGGCDWMAIWQQMYDVERAQTAAVDSSESKHTPDHWANQAVRFARATGRAPQPDHFMASCCRTSSRATSCLTSAPAQVVTPSKPTILNN